MTSELFTIFGSSKIAATSGTCSGAVVVSGFLNLASPIFTDSSGMTAWTSGFAPQNITIPKGTAFKIWEEKVIVTEGVANVNIDVSNNSGVTYRTIGTNSLTSVSGTNQSSVRRTGRPLVIQSGNGVSGDTKVRFSFETPAATGGVFAEYIVEIVELNE